jgi:serine-type D-Ala-D-Ala endopeptidase (penicillin-binding protein 7)
MPITSPDPLSRNRTVITARTAPLAGIVVLIIGLSVPATGIAESTPQKPRGATATSATRSKARPSARARTTGRATYSATSANARRVKLARARAAARARMIREAAIPRFKIDENGAIVPDVHAAAAIIYNPDTGEVLWEEHSQDQRSIASITKVMTAVVFLESDPDLSEQVFVERGDVWRASVTHLRANERVSIEDLLHMLLISSDNAAARVLARVSPWGTDGFVARMNEKAAELGLTSTAYTDPSGLLAANVASAYDMARLIAYAAGDERIAGIMRKADYQVTTSRRRFTIHTTNALVRRPDVDVRGGKTGFIASSGYCLATLLRLPDVDQQVAVVVLGARSNSGRFIEARNLLSWLTSKAGDLFGRKEGQQ